MTPNGPSTDGGDESGKSRTERAEARTRAAESSERGLRASEISYRRLFEAARDGILILELETGRISDVNPFMAELLGFTHAEMVGKTVGELSPFRDIESNKVMLDRLQRDGYVRYEDLPLETIDGRHIAVEFVCNVYQAGDEKVIQCNIRDITERKKAEMATMRLAAIVESSDDAIIGKDFNSIVTSWNRGAETVFGYTADEMEGTSIRRLIPADRQEEEGQILDMIRRGESVRHFETVRLTKDGRLIDVSITVSAIRDAAGRFIGISKVARDISAEKKIDEQLQWKTALLEAQLDSSIDGILVVDLQGNQVLQNWRFADLWKIPSEIVGSGDETAQLAYAASQTKDPARFVERVNHLYTHPDEMARDEIELLDGTTLDRYSSPVRDKAGRHYFRIWSFRDITESRKLEAKMRQAQKMESIGLLAGGIAHDFNNILTAISGNVFLAQIEAAESPALLEHLEEIARASRRATDLVRQILMFSRQNKPEREVIQLNNVVMEALKLLRASVPSTIRIQTELTRTPTVLANPTAIHQVIMNLGTNAWHAMRDRPGILKVEMSVVEVDEDFVKTHPDLHPGRFVRLSVGDTGAGMDRPTMERIFDPFFTTKGPGEGTGLGLALVHGIMKSHDGAISVYSHLGEGTTFHLYFPVFETDAAPASPEAVAIPRGNGEHILFVDDEAVLAALGKKVLERLGYTVIPHTSVIEALDAFHSDPQGFDLVVTDLTMPMMDGLEFGRRLSAIRPGIPMILTTGYSGTMTSASIRDLGFSELLDKPNTARVLGETVHRVLQRARSVPPPTA